MNPTTIATPDGTKVEQVLVLQRLIEPLQEFSSLAILLPVLFAFTVLFLVLFFRQQESLSSLLKTLFVPRLVVLLFGIAWVLYFLAYIGFCATTLFYRLYVNSDFAIDSWVYIILALPLILYVLLLGFLATAVLCIRRPIYLLPLVAVFFCSGVYAVGALLFKPLLSWWVILVPVLAIGLVYVALMYKRDAQSVHPLWAAFLGLLRCGVYAILAFVFLLPGCQTFNTHERHSKVLVLFDVSDSMKHVDDVAGPGEDPKALLSRNGKVLEFLEKKYVGDDNKNLTFLQHLGLKTPIGTYRFGAIIDDVEVEQFIKEVNWDPAKRKTWFFPDRFKMEVPTEANGKPLTPDQQDKLRSKLVEIYDGLSNGTNIAHSALDALSRETASKIQSVIIFSDGQSNLGTSDDLSKLYGQATKAQPPIHIITVGVGYHRPQVGISVDDVQAPQQARPDDKFPVRVPVFGDGLPGKEFTLNLDAVRVVKNADGKWSPVPGTEQRLTKTGKFKEGGERPFDTVEFEVNARKLMGIDPKDDTKDEKVLGTWEFKAWVARIPEERTAELMHVSKHPAYVLVEKRKLRILIFAGGPSREYQFVRTMLYREAEENRVQMCIYLQNGQDEEIDQDVPKEQYLTRFPYKIGKTTDPKQKFYTLTNYDVIIAFDPDWNALETEQLELLKKWVSGPSAGGLIYMAGPINSYQPARPGGRDLTALQTILPVKLKDSRLHGMGLGHDTSRPYPLHFPENAAQFAFMNVGETEKEPLSAWKKFFWDGEEPPASKEFRPVRGIFNYYPVESVRPAAQVLATFAGPPNTRLNEVDEMPYIVTMPYGAGKTIFIGSGELWNLRSFDHEYHQRFWSKLVRYMGGGNLEKINNYGLILMASTAPTGQVAVEAQVLGEDLLPLPRDSRPLVKVIRPPEFDKNKDKDTPESFKLEPKGDPKANNKSSDDDWHGWFSGKFRVFTPGRYTLKIQIPGTTEELSSDITIYRPNPETDNTRPDHGHLYQLATSAQPILKRLNEHKRAELLKILTPHTKEKEVARPEGDVPQSEDRDRIRLYFPLEQAKVIPDLLLHYNPESFSSKGAYLDLWDRGWGGESVSSYYLLTWLPSFVGLLLTVLLLVNRQWISSAIMFVVTILFVSTVVLIGLIFYDLAWPEIPLTLSAYYILLAVPTGIGLFTVAILLTLRRWIFGAALTAATLLYFVSVWLSGFFVDSDAWLVLPLQMSHVLGLVVGLLALEWLTRKLLRLA
jgi:hypothetical protein